MSTSRGRWRGSSDSSSYRRGQTRGSFESRLSWQKPEIPKPPSPPLGPVLTKLCEEDLVESSSLYEYSPRITSCKDIASYNWLDSKEPTILVPGPQPFLFPSHDLELRINRGCERSDSKKRKTPGLDTSGHAHKAQGRRRELLP